MFADYDPGSVEELLPYADDCQAFVSVDAHDRPVGYLLVDLVAAPAQATEFRAIRQRALTDERG